MQGPQVIAFWCGEGEQSLACPGSPGCFPTLLHFPVWKGKVLAAEGHGRENTQQICHLSLRKQLQMSHLATDIPYSGTGDPGLHTGLPHGVQGPGVQLWKFTGIALNEFIFIGESPED